MKRAKDVKLMCGKFGNSKKWNFRNLYKKSKKIIILPEMNISWCLVPKIASTSISSAFLSVTKRKIYKTANVNKNYPQNILRKTYP
ncbi:UNVERIFIED_CONTAM: hypothetical protein RMT77_009255 [Armadillidium vulgare]